MWNQNYFIYVLTNKTNHVLYTGVTNNLRRRLLEHRRGKLGSFTSRYNVNKLVYYEHFSTPIDAIRREKQIKAGSRKRKVQLIETVNPKWQDLFDKNEKEVISIEEITGK